MRLPPTPRVFDSERRSSLRRNNPSISANAWLRQLRISFANSLGGFEARVYNRTRMRLLTGVALLFAVTCGAQQLRIDA